MNQIMIWYENMIIIIIINCIMHTQQILQLAPDPTSSSLEYLSPDCKIDYTYNNAIIILL